MREGLAGERVGASDRIVERVGPDGRRQAGRLEHGAETGPALADQDRGGRPFRGDGRQIAQVDALVPAAGDQDDRRLERPERGDHRVRLRPLRVVDEADAVDDGHGLEPVFDAMEAGGRGPDGRGRQTE